MIQIFSGRRWAIAIAAVSALGTSALGACGQDIIQAPSAAESAPPIAHISAANLSRTSDYVPQCSDCNPWIPGYAPQLAEYRIGVAIDGPTTHQPGQSCQFQAVVNSSGSTPPYSYAWTGAGDSGSSEFFYPNSTGITSSYQVTLTVTDASGYHGSVARTVSVGAGYRPCPE